MKEDCIFCQIISKQIPAKIVFEDEHVIAFLDIDPVAEGHTLIIPKIHAFNIEDIDSDILAHIATVSKRIATKIFDKLSVDGVNILQNNREAASQIIPHYHMHIIPRRKEDGIKVLYTQPSSENDLFAMLDETLNKIILTD